MTLSLTDCGAKNLGGFYLFVNSVIVIGDIATLTALNPRYELPYRATTFERKWRCFICVRSGDIFTSHQ